MTKYVKVWGNEMKVPTEMEHLSDDEIRQSAGLPDDAEVYEM